MRVRSLLLAVCMVVVPLLAMFSHRVPPDLARNARALAARVWASATGGSRAAESPAVAAQSAEPVAQPLAVPQAPTGSQSLAGPSPTATEPQSPASAGRLVAEETLLRLGATAIGCQPIPGGTGMLATCRMAVDPAGELQRVFQAAGEDRPAALRRLLTEVEAWRRSTAWRPPAGRGS